MSKVKVRNKELAKLREFRSGMDVEKYLSGEFKQVLRALQNQFVDVPDGDDIYSMSGIISNLYAINTSSFSAGVVSLSNRVLNSGTVTSNVFYPPVNGKYWIEFGTNVIPTVAGSFVGNLILKYSDGTTVVTYPGSVNLTRAYPSGRIFVDLTISRGVYFETTGDASLIFANFYCEIKKIG